jgi:DNA primase
MTDQAVPEPHGFISLSDLETYDPHPSGGGRERRFLCPFCGDCKPKNDAHRSLSLNSESGVYYCYRCKVGGKLRDHWEERPKLSRRERERAKLRKAFELPPAPDSAPDNDPASTPAEWKKHLQGLTALLDTPGARYLAQRHLAPELCHAAGVMFCGNWLGRAAVVFPIHDPAGALVAAQGRYMDRRADPKTRTVGPKSLGIFSTLDVWEAPAVILVEAPIDALSLAMAGYPAVALCGKDAPEWLPKWLSKKRPFGRVLLGFDADDAGDQAATELTATFISYGAKVGRLRPEGSKDWNEFLQFAGRDGLADWLAAPVLLES